MTKHRSVFAAGLWLLGLALAVPAPGPLLAQQPPVAPPAPVRADTVPADTVVEEALVLSGGGSRGLAHVGVFIGLERLGHNPDLVVGTSMGAVTGALYAAGYPPEEIERQIRAEEWGATFTPAPLLLGPEREVRYPLVTFDRDVDPLRFNRGIIPQWRINRALVRLLFDANARSRGDFDRLARRFRAVATDLKSGDTVVIDRGDLARAARASLAVPGVFAPVEWGDRSLVDGGISSNVPTPVARELGADYIIAVDVGRPSVEIDGRAPFQVAGRAIDLLQENAQRDPIPADVVILPRIPPSFYGITFPADPSSLIALGLEATLRDVRPTPGNRPEARRLPPAPEQLRSLVVEAPDPAIEALVRRVFADVVPGPYAPDQVLTAVDRLYTTGLFEGVWPRVVEDTGVARSPALVVRVEAPPAISIAGAAGFDTDRGVRAWSAVERTTAWGSAPVQVTGSASLDRIEQWASVSARVFSLRFSPLVASTGVFYRETDVRRFGAGIGGDQEVQRVGAWLGGEFQQLLAERVATAVLRVERVSAEGGPGGFSVGPHLRFTAPEAEAPVVGVTTRVEGEWRWGEIAYRRVAARGSLRRVVGALRLAGVADVALASAGAPADVRPALGDQHAVPGLRWGEERGGVRALAGADAAYPLPTGGSARVRARLGVVADEVGELGQGARGLVGVEAGGLWSTPFGAASLALGVNTRGDRRFVLSLGPEF